MTDPLSLADAAAELALSPTTLRAQVHAGRLAATKIGGVWIVERAEIERYRREHLGRPGQALTEPSEE